MIKKKREGLGMWHVCIRRDMCKGLLWGDLEERDHLENIDEDGKIRTKTSSNTMGGFSLGRYGSRMWIISGLM
jgi:hypothetical protein